MELINFTERELNILLVLLRKAPLYSKAYDTNELSIIRFKTENKLARIKDKIPFNY